LTHVFQLVDQGTTHADETFVHLHHQFGDLVRLVQACITCHVADQVVRYELRQDAEGHFVTFGALVQFRQLWLGHGVTPNGQRKGERGELPHP
jgi:hypothetical protein